MIESLEVEESINDILLKSMSYSAYRDQIIDFVANHSTSGNQKTVELINYTKLNDSRMSRWDKTLKVSDDVKERASNFKGNVTWLVLTESWCGDAAHVIPVINKVAELSKNIDLRLVYRDENESLMFNFLTDGNKSIPKLIMIDNYTGDVIDTFGPRPSVVTNLVKNYMAEHGSMTPEFKEDLQRWYNKDKGENTLNDLLNMLNL